MTHLELFVRGADLRRTGEVTDLDKLEVVGRHNGVGTWVLELDRASAAAQLALAGEGIVVVRDGHTLMSGPRTYRQVKQEGGTTKLTLAGVDDSVWLDRRLALPPAGLAYDTRRGPAEDVLRGYVDANLGPGAAVERRLAGLTLPASQARGASVVANGRYQSLLELAQVVGLAGGIGFRLVQVGLGLQLEVRVPADRRRDAVFSAGLGNLAGFDYSETAPTATYAYVGGQGEGAARTIVQGGAAGAPYRAEVFKDQRDTDELAALEQSRDEALTEGAGTTALALSPIDTGSVAYGREYALGDIVTVLVDGEQLQDVVREVKLTYDTSGTKLAPVVGTPGARDPEVPRLFDALHRLALRQSRLERR